MNRADRRRMERLCGRLMAVYQDNETPYNRPGVHPPQLLMPEGIKPGSREHAFFLFVLCLWMRGGIESDTAIKSLSGLYELDSDLFVAEKAQYVDPEKLAQLLKQFGLGFSRDINARFWVNNSQLLVERWAGDPRNIFHDFNRYHERQKWKVAVSRIKNGGLSGKRGGFGGFREKMVSMLIYFLMEQELIARFDFPVPVDFHVARMMVMHRVFKLNPVISYTGKQLNDLLDAIRMETYRYAKKHSISSVELCNALWLFSRSMCSESPAFWVTPGERKGRRTEITPHIPSWSKAESLAYDRTCGMCPVHESCVYVVRSGYWYIQGRIHAEEKPIPPQLSLYAPHEIHEMTNIKRYAKGEGAG